jgi:hypothetical protein
VTDLVRVLARVPARRLVATADVAASQADAQVHPLAAFGEAFVAAMIARLHRRSMLG